jgi:hypothetical protein
MEAMTAQEMLETPDLIAVGVAGDEVRRRMHGVKTTFVRVLEVHVDGPLQALPPRTQAGEIRIIGVPSSLDAAVSAVRACVAFAGSVPVTGFSAADLLSLGEIGEVVGQLKGARLAAIAHLPIDRVPDARGIAREVISAGLAINTIVADTLDEESRIEICARARDLQSEVGSFRAFAPLPRSVSVAMPTTGCAWGRSQQSHTRTLPPEQVASSTGPRHDFARQQRAPSAGH